MSSYVEAVPEVDRPVDPVTPRPKERLLSLDVFRGFTLLGMVLVNSHPGEIYPGLGHVKWNGWGFADLIFPFFVFIVGVAIPYSFASRLARGESREKLFMHILLRCVLLFAIGVFLNGYPRFDLSTLRVMNVLQRIAICYFLASIIFVYIRMTTRSIVWLCGTILVLYFRLDEICPSTRLRRRRARANRKLGQLLRSAHNARAHAARRLGREEPAGQLPGSGHDAYGVADRCVSADGATRIRNADAPVFLWQPLHGGGYYLGPVVSDQPASVDQFAGAIYGRHGSRCFWPRSTTSWTPRKSPGGLCRA